MTTSPARLKAFACFALLVSLSAVALWAARSCRHSDGDKYRAYEREHHELREAHLSRKSAVISARGQRKAMPEDVRQLAEMEEEYRAAYRALRVRHGLPPEKPRDEDAKHVR